MLGTRTRKNRIVKKWHSRAILIDPGKTKITILNSHLKDSVEIKSNTGITSIQAIISIEEQNDILMENSDIDELFGTPVSFVLVDDQEEGALMNESRE